MSDNQGVKMPQVNMSLELSETDDSNKLSKVREDIIEDCMVALGYPVISLFITKGQINRLIDFSVRRCASKACPKFLQTLYASGVIDVSEYQVEAISAIYQGDITSGVSSGNSEDCGSSCGMSSCDICDKLCQYRPYSYGMLKGSWNNELYDMLAYQSAKSEVKNLLLDDYYLDVREQKLYLDNYNGIITMEYTKSEITIEDLQNDTFWSSWVRDYTLAMVKITEGRIRSKYKVSSGVFEIESDELISEGNSDKQELDTKLDENIGYWNIMR